MPRTLLEMAEDAAAGAASVDDLWALESERRRRSPTGSSYVSEDDFVDMPDEDKMERSMGHKCSNGASNTTDNDQQWPDPT